MSGELLVLVTGTGRSGTSTISGSLHHLGLHVPGPFLGANKSNPKGFYESTWAVEFHKQITHRARINDFDGQPTALDQARDAVTPQMRNDLADWLRLQAAAAPQVAVKDPRSVWAQQVWRDAAAEAGIGIRFLSMLRHPAEVIGSRATYYANKADESHRRRYEICSVARWVNSSLISERETRGEARTFVPYTDLLDDWRTVVGRVADELGLTLNSDLAPRQHHPVDDFIDPDLRRVRVTWEDLNVPEDLQAIAQEIWGELLTLCNSRGGDPAASARLDRLAARYDRLFCDAAAISLDATEAAVQAARRQGAREARERIAKKREVAQRDMPVDERPLRDVSGRELLRAALQRLGRRLRLG